MQGVNKAIIIGTLGRDPEVRYTASGDAVATLSVATSENWKDKSGEKQERTEWHRLTIFGRTGELAGEYLKKGSQAYFEGKITTRKWTDKDGADRYTTEIVVDKMQFLGGKKDYETAPAANKGNPERGQKQKQQARDDLEDDLEDDIPF